MKAFRRPLLFTITIDTRPFAIVTVPSPLSVTVTFGPVPVPPPAMFAPAVRGANEKRLAHTIKDERKAACHPFGR